MSAVLLGELGVHLRHISDLLEASVGAPDAAFAEPDVGGGGGDEHVSALQASSRDILRNFLRSSNGLEPAFASTACNGLRSAGAAVGAVSPRLDADQLFVDIPPAASPKQRVLQPAEAWAQPTEKDEHVRTKVQAVTSAKSKKAVASPKSKKAPVHHQPSNPVQEVDGCDHEKSLGMSEIVVQLMKTLNQTQTGSDMKEAGVRPFCRRLVVNQRFEMTMAIVIVSNAVCMGLQTNWKTRHNDDNSVLRIIDLMFSAVFLGELIIRLIGDGMKFFLFHNPVFMWNMFDFFIILFCLVDEGVALLQTSGGDKSVNISVLRLLRVLRLARILRVIRVMRFFRDLRVMISGILGSMKSLTWAIVLLFLLTYLFAVCIVEMLVQADADFQNQGLLDFNNLIRTMYTLFKCVIGGMDWGDAGEVLIEFGYTTLMLFMAYVTFSILCVLNIVTGVFVENANKITAKAEGEALMEELENRKAWLDEVKELFDAAIESDPARKRFKSSRAGQVDKEVGKLNAENFERLVEDIRVQAVFRKLGIELERNHAKGLFSLLDFDGSGEVDAEEFAMGLDQLHGNARSIDVVRLRHHLSKLDEKVDDMYVQIVPEVPESESEEERLEEADELLSEGAQSDMTLDKVVMLDPTL